LSKNCGSVLQNVELLLPSLESSEQVSRPSTNIYHNDTVECSNVAAVSK